MSIKKEIKNKFGELAFERPVFYSNPGGLRFELSQGGDWLEQFQVALSKAQEICADIFNDDITVCVRIFGGQNLLSVLSVLKELRDIGLYPSVFKEHWKEKNKEDPEWAKEENEFWHTIAFTLPSNSLNKLLWCSLACDLGIKPCPPVNLFLFDLDRLIEVFPYDDRGMDIVGPNHDFLSSLYSKYSHYLLEYDKEVMDETFTAKP